MVLNIIDNNLGLKSCAVNKLFTFAACHFVEYGLLPIEAHKLLAELEEEVTILYKEVRAELLCCNHLLEEFEQSYHLFRPLIPRYVTIDDRAVLYCHIAPIKFHYQCLISLLKELKLKLTDAMAEQVSFSNLYTTLKVIHLHRNSIFTLVGLYVTKVLDNSKTTDKRILVLSEQLCLAVSTLLYEIMKGHEVAPSLLIEALEKVFEEHLTISSVRTIVAYACGNKLKGEQKL